jgi:hypothetical protein
MVVRPFMFRIVIEPDFNLRSSIREMWKKKLIQIRRIFIPQIAMVGSDSPEMHYIFLDHQSHSS